MSTGLFFLLYVIGSAVAFAVFAGMMAYRNEAIFPDHPEVIAIVVAWPIILPSYMLAHVARHIGTRARERAIEQRQREAEIDRIIAAEKL